VNGFGFLAHFLDPFQLVDPVLWFIADSGEGGPVNLQQLSNRSEALVTYDAPRLVAALRKAAVQPPVLVDIRDGLKLLSGLSKDQGGPFPVSNALGQSRGGSLLPIHLSRCSRDGIGR
jgi:hypothetical protein